jgi:conjugal transfer pilus assembly protein TraE
MDLKFAGDNARKLNIRLTLTAMLLGASVATNLVMSVLVMNARSVVLVPTLPEEIEVATGGIVDRGYLERVTRDVTYLMLNRSPETARYFERQIEKISEPATYQEIKKTLVDDRRQRVSTRTSQSFHPYEFYVDPGKLYAEVRGTLEIANGTDIIDSQRKIYALRFVRRGAMIRLSSFVELKTPEESQAERLQPTPISEIQQ